MTIEASISSIRRQLAESSGFLQVFESCYALLQQLDYRAIGVSGSLLTQDFDCYSDIDFELIVGEEADVTTARETLLARLPGVRGILALFPATHLRLNNLLVAFFDGGDVVIKIDICITTQHDFALHPKGRVIEDCRFVASTREELAPVAAPEPDFKDLHHKFCGWIWYTYGKIARGELFEAVDSLDTMRRFAVVPCLQYLNGLPMEGYRRLERHLSKQDQALLAGTWPTTHERDDLFKALSREVEVFSRLMSDIADRLKPDPRDAKLEQMWKIVAAAEAVRERGFSQYREEGQTV